MFLLNEIKDISKYLTIISEADEDIKDIDNEDQYQAGDADTMDDEAIPDTKEETAEDTSTEEETTPDEDTTNEEEDQYQAGDADTMDDSMSTEDGNEEDTDTTEDGGDPELTRKIFLLESYEELYNEYNSLLTSLELYSRDNPAVKLDDFTYVRTNLEQLKEKLFFTISYKFKTFTYQKLLILFEYYKEGLANLIKLTERIVESEQDD